MDSELTPFNKRDIIFKPQSGEEWLEVYRLRFMVYWLLKMVIGYGLLVIELFNL